LEWVDDPDGADITVAFNKDSKGTWSMVGTESQGERPSMNFNWLRNDTPVEELTGTVLHEFGHALALKHEHQHCNRPFDFDKEKVYKYFNSRKSGLAWSKEKGDHNVLRVASGAAPFTGFDRRSIMCYELPWELLKNPEVLSGDQPSEQALSC
jgi:hypothetical protein